MAPQIILDWRAVLIFVVGGIATGWAIYRSRGLASQDARLPMNDCEQRIATLEEVVKKQSNAIEALQGLLYEKQNSIHALEAKVRELEISVATKSVVTKSSGEQSIADPMYLLVAVGSDPIFQRDLVAMRKVKARTGIRWTRLYPVTKKKLVDKMSRESMNRRPVKYIHFALHSDENGLQFDDGIASPQWISENVQGARLVLIAGCRSDTVGDYLSVAEAVVALLEDVPNDVAARFTEAFWGLIGEGVESEEAFHRAIDTVPQISEFAEYNG